MALIALLLLSAGFGPAAVSAAASATQPFLTSASTVQEHEFESLFPGLTGNELVDSLRVHYRPASVTSSYHAARDFLFAVVHLDDNNTLTCVYTGDQLTWDPNGGQSVRQFAQDNGWNTEHIWPQSMGAGSGNARIDMHHLRPIRGDVNGSRSNYPFAFLETADVTRWWRGNTSQASEPVGDPGDWSRTRSTAPGRFQVMDDYMGDVARAMFYFYTMYPGEVRNANPDYLYHQMDVLRSYHNLDPVGTDELGWTHEIATVQDGKPNPFVVDTTLIRRAYFENYEPWDPADQDLDSPDVFLLEYTFAGTQGCAEQDPDPIIPGDRINATPMLRFGVECNDGNAQFNSRNWATSGALSDEHYVNFTLSAADRSLDFSDDAVFTYSIRRSGTGPQQFAWHYRIDDGEFVELTAGTLSGTSDYTRELSLDALGGNAESVAFRLYGWDAGSGGGTMRINHLSVSGGLENPTGVYQLQVPGNHPGWRMMSVPVGGKQFSDLAKQNLIQGIEGTAELYADDYPGANPEDAEPNLFRYVRSGDQWNWVPPQDIFDEITPGSGFIWYFFNNDDGPSRALPFTMELTGVTPDQDVEVSLEEGWNLAGNPFETALDRQHIVYLDDNGEVIAPISALQIWDPEAGNGAGSYRIPDPGEPVAAWQGFILEDNGAARLRFRPGGKTDGGSFYKPVADEEPSSFRLQFTLTGVDESGSDENESGGYRVIDHALSLLVHPQGKDGADAFDLKKLTPLDDGDGSGRFATLAFEAQREEGVALLAQESRPASGEELALPVNLVRSGFGGDFELRWEGLETVPSDRDVALADHHTGDVTNLREAEMLAFRETDAMAVATDEPRFELRISGRALSGFADDGDQLPDRITLHQNYPNPFNPETSIRFDLPGAAHVRLEVYDMLGRRVAVLLDEPLQPNRHQVRFDAGGLSSGVYIYRLITDGEVQNRKMTLVK